MMRRRPQTTSFKRKFEVGSRIQAKRTTRFQPQVGREFVRVMSRVRRLRLDKNIL